MSCKIELTEFEAYNYGSRFHKLLNQLPKQNYYYLACLLERVHSSSGGSEILCGKAHQVRPELKYDVVLRQKSGSHKPANLRLSMKNIRSSGTGLDGPGATTSRVIDRGCTVPGIATGGLGRIGQWDSVFAVLAPIHH